MSLAKFDVRAIRSGIAKRGSFRLPTSTDKNATGYAQTQLPAYSRLRPTSSDYGSDLKIRGSFY